MATSFVVYAGKVVFGDLLHNGTRADRSRLDRMAQCQEARIMRPRTVVALIFAGLLWILLCITGTPLKPRATAGQWQLESIPFLTEVAGYAALRTSILAIGLVFLDLKTRIRERRNERAGQTN